VGHGARVCAHRYQNFLSLGHAKKIFCFTDSAGLFLADFKKNKKFLINIPDITIVTGQEYSLERAL
jgi:hypothetical protein